MVWIEEALDIDHLDTVVSGRGNIGITETLLDHLEEILEPTESFSVGYSSCSAENDKTLKHNINLGFFEMLPSNEWNLGTFQLSVPKT